MIGITQSKIHRVSPKELIDVIDRRTPLGLFLTKEGRTWVAVDNSTGDAWTEDFRWKRQAIRWLRGKFEVGNLAGLWERISDAASLITVAKRQGVTLDTVEADIILGYMEGHDFCLMADHGGRMVRHDEQYGDNHRRDEPYTIHDAVEFCQEMNEDLIQDSDSPKEYLSQLRKDEKILDALMARLAQESINKERKVLLCVY